MINSMFCFSAGSAPSPVKPAFVESPGWLKATWFWLKTFVRYCHLEFLNYALPLSNLFYLVTPLGLEELAIFVSHVPYLISNSHDSSTLPFVLRSHSLIR